MPVHLRNLLARALHVLSILSLVWLLPVGPGLTHVFAAGTITGQVYQDFNGNGARDTAGTLPNAGAGTVPVAIDSGIGSVTVSAYDASGALVGTTTTAANGTYTLNASGTGPYRIEFTNLPAGYQPGPHGADNGTTVRFVPDGATANVDLGINYPADYCQNNPTLANNCYVFGDQLTGPYNTRPALISFPYSAGTDSVATLSNVDQPTTHATSLRANQIGTTWGIAWARTTKRLYSSAFMKKHAGFGPGADGVSNNTDDAGAIYVINPATNAVVTTFTVPNATANAHNTANYIQDNFNTGWDAVGKRSLGGLALSEDESRLFVMNLENRTLYALNATTGAVIASQAVPLSLPLSAPTPPGMATCPASDVRPFAVSVYRGLVYVGLMCTGESTANADTFTDSNSNGRYDPPGEAFTDGDGNGIYTLKGDARALQAFVYQVNPTTLAFGASPVFQARLNYPRGLVETSTFGFAGWQPWVTGFNGTVGSDITQIIYPQPWLTDIAFDNGNLILGIRDRLGDIAGANSPENPASPGTDFLALSAGDTLRACGNPGSGWTLESNGRCGGLGAGPQDTGQGPGAGAIPPATTGFGEYYFSDNYSPFHEEVSVGAQLQIAGFPDLVASVFDPFPVYANPANGVFDGGLRWLTNSTGAFRKAYRLFDGGVLTYPAEPYFGKAASLGDLISLCDAAPIEIGNYVWLDSNKDGKQDPGETPLAGVTVRLYAPDGVTVLATAVTNAQGEYYFSSATGTTTSNAVYGITGLTPNTSGFTVRLDNPADYTGGGPLAPYSPTLVNNDGTANGDSRDSDGLVVGGFPRTTVNTGGPGANDHTLDFGFATNPTAIQLLYFRVAGVWGPQVTLAWATAAEIDNYGFKLYRAGVNDFAQATLVHFEPSAPSAGAGSGAAYHYIDSAPGKGAWWYWLVDVSRQGVETNHAPVTTAFVISDTPPPLFLPMVRR